MPELPEVETTRRGLLPLLGQMVRAVILRNSALRWPVPAELPVLLPGQRLQSLERRAKYLLAGFDRGTLLLHLGMSGRLCLLAGVEPPGKHDHLEVVFVSGTVLRLRDPRRFGAALWLEGDPLQHPLLRDLGVEPLDEEFSGALLHRISRGRYAAVKNFIMDSHVVAGIGNIYASEALFRARIHPASAAGSLGTKRYASLVQAIQATLRAAITAGGSSLRDYFGADGNPGYFQQQYFVYGRSGEPCRVCGSLIRSMRLGQRSTFYCPRCQAR